MEWKEKLRALLEGMEFQNIEKSDSYIIKTNIARVKQENKEDSSENE